MEELLAEYRALLADLRERNRLIREARKNEKALLDAIARKFR